MAIPDYQSIMRPLLELARDRKEHSIRELLEPLSVRFHLTEEDRNALNSSGQTTFYNRAAWARTYLKQAGLLETIRRGSFRITERGQDALRKTPERIDMAFLLQYKEFADFRQRKRTEETDRSNDLVGENNLLTPEESVETAFKKFRQELEVDLLQTLKTCSPSLFEKIVVDVLVKMGYGGQRQDAGEIVGKSGDGGIDGLIKEDRLGLDMIYIQAKKWEGTVSRPEVQKFAGALQGMRAKKGVFITTSSFTKEAIGFVSGIENKIVLIDGEQLAQYMIDFNVGVSIVETYETKKVDLDYFEE
ncbi:MAG: restriction endonuclease [Leptospirales bacterium]